MTGELRNRERFGAAYDKDLLAGLRKLSKDTRIPASKLIDEALEDLLKKYGVEVKRESQE
ncbi:conserved hypothetical protein [Candidatus Desulfosporosinus infrequens]|uniref:Predicted DNA-binding protein ribbon-helix-helix domain-containing protein n=1 Tax=Candidatus Desulfosporosinus infrequens TaxID=2043169 RepID=A0A2U3LGV3_9FIRM|nr:conserved hypothetical protein [Candidatus Desulfosporosinus infrequens]